MGVGNGSAQANQPSVPESGLGSHTRTSGLTSQEPCRPLSANRFVRDGIATALAKCKCLQSVAYVMQGTIETEQEAEGTLDRRSDRAARRHELRQEPSRFEQQG